MFCCRKGGFQTCPYAMDKKRVEAFIITYYNLVEVDGDYIDLGTS